LENETAVSFSHGMRDDRPIVPPIYLRSYRSEADLAIPFPDNVRNVGLYGL
jgi:hypothetical protein